MKIGMITDSLPGTDFDTLVAVLAAAAYHDVFSIEHEDPMLPALEGVEKSVALLRNVLINQTRRGGQIPSPRARGEG
jgi:hypothetical protein